MSDDLYFPEELSEEDRQLWFKELALSGEFRSWNPALFQEKGRPTRWELETEDWTAVYEDCDGCWERVGEPKYWGGLRRIGKLSANFIREKLSQPSIASQVLMSEQDYKDVLAWEDDSVEEE
jgi:hypothetical protein